LLFIKFVVHLENGIRKPEAQLRGPALYAEGIDKAKNLEEQSTRKSLPGLSPNGYAIVDDFGAAPACRRAVLDFRERNSIKEESEKLTGRVFTGGGNRSNVDSLFLSFRSRRKGELRRPIMKRRQHPRSSQFTYGQR
jgi:hypothetical protein